jgi:hypothetical protein
MRISHDFNRPNSFHRFSQYLEKSLWNLNTRMIIGFSIFFPIALSCRVIVNDTEEKMGVQ